MSNPHSPQRIKITDINEEKSLRVRVQMDNNAIQEYAAYLAANKPPMPPIVLFGPDVFGKYFLSEGWHRIAAHKLADRTHIMAYVHELKNLNEGWKEALAHALGSNTWHGVRRTNADKKRCIELAIKHWPEWSYRRISEACQVDDMTVKKIRTELEDREQVQPVSKSVGKDGKAYDRQVRNSAPESYDLQVPKSAPDKIGDFSDVTNDGESTSGECQDMPRSVPLPPKPITHIADDGVMEDERGTHIQPARMALWGRRKEVYALMKRLSEITATVRAYVKDNDPMWMGDGSGHPPLDWQAFEADMKRAYGNLDNVMPYCVCTFCNGAGKCRACSGTGFMSKFRFKTIALREHKRPGE